MIKITFEQYQEYENSYIGLCRACEAERDVCEPDAEYYLCEECGEEEVFGVPQLLIMGELEIIDEPED